MVILPEIEFGNGNFSNLVSVREALAMGKKAIVVGGRNIAERDHTGGKAAELYQRIIDGGAKQINADEQVLDFLKQWEQ